MMPVHELAILSAECPETPEVRYEREVAGSLVHGRRAHLARRPLLDQAVQRLHIVAQVVVNFPEVKASLALGGRQPGELGPARPCRVVEKLDVVDHDAEIAARTWRSKRAH